MAKNDEFELFFGESISIFLSRSRFSIFSLFIGGFVARFIVFLLHGIVAGQPF